MPLTEYHWTPDFEVRESHRARRVRIVIHPPGRNAHGQIEVVVPAGFDRKRLPHILEQKRHWLERTLNRINSEYRSNESIEPPTVITLPAIGQKWQVEYRSGANRCREQHGRLLVCHRKENDWQRPLQRWLTVTARSVLPPWLDETSQQLGLDYGKVTIRAQRTRWGSCSSRKNISINRGLLFLPPEQVHYLLVHELCHTRQMNHSPRYWALVAEHIPNYKPLDKALRRAFSSIPWWARP
jgi:predicted metal-dependent hydrolase